jgi:hypothetical protein
LFERIVEQCIAAGLVEGEQMSVDGTFIMANASHHSRILREQFTEAAQVNYGARKYLEKLEQENGDGEPIHQQGKVSTTDPDSTYLTKGNRAAELGYFDMRRVPLWNPHPPWRTAWFMSARTTATCTSSA